MHAQAYEWVRRFCSDAPARVLDIGGRDINGSPRALFPHARYRVLDIAAGPGVDVVADAATWTPDAAYDAVVCCEVFEHTPTWPAICVTAYAATRPGGLFILTTAAPGRASHSGVDGGELRPGEHYANIGAAELEHALAAAGWAEIDVDRAGADVRAIATKPGGSHAI